MGPYGYDTDLAGWHYLLWEKAGGQLLRAKGQSLIQILGPEGWMDAPPSAIDAVTGMGPDPYSCGEWADELTLEQARREARKRGQPDAVGPPRGRPLENI